MQAIQEAAVHQPGEIIAWAGEAGLTAHACSRSKLRQISLREIRQTLEAPDRGRRGRDNKFVYIRYFEARRIKVVFVIEDGIQVVITCGDRDMDDQGRLI